MKKWIIVAVMCNIIQDMTGNWRYQVDAFGFNIGGGVSCSERYSCFNRKSCGAGYRYGCLCDMDCLLFEDCCPDVFSSCFGMEDNDTNRILNLFHTETTTDTGHIKNWSEKKKLKEKSECRPTKVAGDIWMVSRCPESWLDQSIRDGCENPFTLLGFDLPVSYNRIPYITFRNRYCALCHGISLEDVTGWIWKGPCSFKLDFNGTIDSDEAFNEYVGETCQKLCIKHTPPKQFTPRLCERKWPLTYCNGYDNFTDSQLLQKEHCLLCNVMRSPVKEGFSGPTYKNKYCDMALDVSLEGASCVAWRNLDHLFIGCSGLDNLFNFKTKDESLLHCGENEIQIGQRCKYVGCTEWQVEVDGSCINNDNITVIANRTTQIFPEGYTHLFLDLFLPNLSDAEDVFKQLAASKLYHPFWEKLEFTHNVIEDNVQSEPFTGTPQEGSGFSLKCDSFGHKKTDIYRETEWISADMLSSIPESLNNVSMYLEKLKSAGLNITLNPNLPLAGRSTSQAKNRKSLLFSDSIALSFALKETALSIEAIRDIYNFYYSIVHAIPDTVHYSLSLRNFQSRMAYHCHSLIERIVPNIMFEPLGNETFLNIDDTYLYPIENVLYMEVLDSSNNEDPCNVALVCQTATLDCRSVRLNSDEYELTENKEATIDGKTITLTEGLYIQDGEYLSICEHLLRNTKSETERIVAITLSSITMAALVITFVIYCMLAELRNLPGKCLMSLCVTLTLAHLLIILDRTDNDTLCVGIAAAAHFMWLASFSWMTIMAFDIALTFRSMASGVGGAGGGRFRKYLIIAYTLPAVVVALSIALDISDQQLLRVGYGDMSLCWITDGIGALVLFGGPVFISITFNFGFFVVILRSIEKTARESSMATESSNNKKRYFAYLRISFIMGFTWLFGFLDAWLDHPALLYTYLVLNGLQGVFIAVSFLANDRTRSLFKKRLGMAESSASTRSTSQPSTYASKSQ